MLNMRLPIKRDIARNSKPLLISYTKEKIGDILEMRGRGKEDRRGGGEDLWVLGSHIMNLIQYFGSDPLWCFATVLQDGHPITKEDVAEGAEGIGPLAGDTVHAMYRLSEGQAAYFDSHRDAAGSPSRFGLQIFGSKGVIEILTGYIPAVYYLPDGSWSPGRSQKDWLPVSSAGIDKPEPLGRWRIARRKRRRLPRFDRRRLRRSST